MPETQLLALSIIQPWLWAILERHKGFPVNGAYFAIENRKWRPPERVLGRRIALHASAKWDDDGESFVDERLILDAQPGRERELPPKAFVVRSAIVGTARLIGAMPARVREAPRRVVELDGLPGCHLGPLTFAEQTGVLCSPWTFGPWAWVLADVRKVQPIACKGALGFWRVPSDVAARVKETADAI